MHYPIRYVHRRRSRRRRRARWMVVAGILACLLVMGWKVTANSVYFRSHFSRQHLGPRFQSVDSSRGVASSAAPSPIFPPGDRPVYRYSVIPGGVRSGEELRAATERDRAVAQHYAGFDYERARIVELPEARAMYLSYRLRDKIYWTRRRMALRKGEKLLTDGKIMARTRCANRVSEEAQPEASPQEPPAEQLEEPLMAANQVPFPGNFESPLATRPAPPGFTPAGPALLPNQPFGRIGFPATFPPPLPTGCEPSKPKQKGEPGAAMLNMAEGDAKKKKKNPCGPPASVPEPGTLVMVASGLAGLYWRYRRSAS